MAAAFVVMTRLMVAFWITDQAESRVFRLVGVYRLHFEAGRKERTFQGLPSDVYEPAQGRGRHLVCDSHNALAKKCLDPCQPGDELEGAAAWDFLIASHDHYSLC